MKNKKILLALLPLLLLSSCGEVSELSAIKKSGQYSEITYEEYTEKVAQKENFVFFLRQKDCASCKAYYPVINKVVSSNKDYKIYSMLVKDLEEIEQLSLSSRIYEAIGRDYYASKNYSEYTLYTPTTVKVENGRFEFADIDQISEKQLSNYYQSNFITLRDYYAYNRKVANNDSFKLYVTNEEGSEYLSRLEGYYAANADKQAFYLNYQDVSTAYQERLINRINYFLDEDSKIQTLPNNFVLEYNEGSISKFEAKQYTNEDLK